MIAYEGTQLFSEIDQTGPWDKFMSPDLMKNKDDNGSYWTEFFDKSIYINRSDSSGVNVRSCTGIRTISLSGYPRQNAEVEEQMELAWVDQWKYQHTYEIKSGWRLWDSATATMPSDGKDVSKPWKFEVDCGDYGCIGSGAVTMGASALALAVTLLAY